MVRVLNDKIINITGNEKIPRIIVGNKSDLDKQRFVFFSLQRKMRLLIQYYRKVSKEEGQKLAQELGCPFLECSAKLNENIGNDFNS